MTEQTLEKALRTADVDLAGMHWVCIHLPTGVRVTHRAEDTLGPTDAGKWWVMVAVEIEVATGNLAWSHMIEVIEADKDGAARGLLKELRTGTRLSLENLVRLMLIRNDDVAVQAIVRHLPNSAVERSMANWAIPSTRRVSDARGLITTTVIDIESTWRQLNDGCVDEDAAEALGLTRDGCRHLADILSRQQARAGLTDLLPKLTKVSHLPSYGAGGRLHAGVIYQSGVPAWRLVIAVDPTDAWSDDGLPSAAVSSRAIARVARACFDHGLMA